MRTAFDSLSSMSHNLRISRQSECYVESPALISLTAGAIQQDEFDIVTPWHVHEVHQLQYAFEGSMVVEDARQRALLPCQLAAWIPAGTSHRTRVRRIRSVSVMFTPSLINDADGQIKIIAVPSLLRELLKEALRWPAGKPLGGKGEIFFRAFAMLLEGWIEREAPLVLPTSNDPRISAAMEITLANLPEATIEDAARAANLSVRTLQRRFEAEGIGWGAYRRRARLLEAVTLLDETRLSIGEIAARIGYENQGAFAKVFQDLMGLSPIAFRSRVRHGGEAGR